MKKLLKKRFVRFCIFGSIGGLIEIGLFYFLNEILNFHYTIANVLSFTVSVIFLYYCNNKYVYDKNPLLSKRARRRKFILFIVTRIIGLFLDTGVLAICIDYFHIDNLISKFISCISTTVVNYFMGKIIFK